MPESPRRAPSPTTRVLRDLYEDDRVSWGDRSRQVRVRARMLGDALGRAGAPHRVVDLGCGPGDNTDALGLALPGTTMIGLDWAVRGLAAARGRGLPVACGALDPARLPLADGSCDAVSLCEVIEHLVDTDLLLDEIRRVLRPGGVLLVTTPNLAAWFNRLLLAGGVQPMFSEVSTRAIYGRPGEEVVGHLRLFTARALRGFLAGAGFEDVRLAGVPFHAVPAVGRPLDRLLAHVPALAAGLVATAVRPATPDDPSPRGEDR